MNGRSINQRTAEICDTEICRFLLHKFSFIVSVRRTFCSFYKPPLRIPRLFLPMSLGSMDSRHGCCVVWRKDLIHCHEAASDDHPFYTCFGHSGLQYIQCALQTRTSKSSLLFTQNVHCWSRLDNCYDIFNGGSGCMWYDDIWNVMCSRLSDFGSEAALGY